MKKSIFITLVALGMMFGLSSNSFAQENDYSEVVSDQEVFRPRQERIERFIERIKERHPDADFSNLQWLKKHPRVARKLMKNKEWLNKHPEIAKRIRKHHQWVKENRGDLRETRRDRRQIRDDKRDLRGDRRELKEAYRSRDREGFRDSFKEYRQDRRDIAYDRREFRRDRRDIRNDRRDDCRYQGHQRRIPRRAKVRR